MVGDSKQEEHEYHDHTAQGKVDVKAPPPSNICGEGATDQWAEHRRDPKNCTQKSLVFRPLV